MRLAGRRKFLKRVLAGGIALAVLGSTGLTIGLLRRRRRAAVEPALLEFAARDVFSSRIGRIYLNEDPVGATERSMAVLAARLLAGLGNDPGNVEDELKRHIVEDFERGRICNIRGWVLSRTECRLAAMALLSRGNVITDEVDEKQAVARKEELPFEELPVVEFANLGKWGPQRGRVGEPFNPQPSGVSAMWLLVENLKGRHYRLYLDGRQMRTSVSEFSGVITASLPAEEALAVTSVPGRKAVYLADILEQRRQLVGYFTVE